MLHSVDRTCYVSLLGGLNVLVRQLFLVLLDITMSVLPISSPLGLLQSSLVDFRDTHNKPRPCVGWVLALYNGLWTSRLM